MTPFAKYFDRVAVINLSSRPDRLKSIVGELTALGFDSASIQVPNAPITKESDGFPSRGVHGNFLSHLGILKDAQNAGARRILVVEDDAIFSRHARKVITQDNLIREVDKYDWAMWFLGHSISRSIRSEKGSVIPTQSEFIWAHAYAVNGQSLPELIDFMENMIAQPKGFRLPKMYIDGAYYHYRAEVTSKLCLVSNPAISVQKGSDSNLAGPRQPGRLRLHQYPKYVARALRDTLWRWTHIHLLRDPDRR